ncbi:RDD family protein [Nocardioides sp. GY 10113]|uniref:RDD family protein n=1 Tax=Nocardioides sp. GY 10113 TaxID=2569761 RepID=UPI0010A876F1|nr:RDD family protein [Nocardioides sp. GY 10113]TIC88836.1 RDD family protein [Nocardioides sp. GY 10113]
MSGRTEGSVSGRYAGGVSRAVSAAIDLGVVIGSYTVGVWVGRFLLDVLFGIGSSGASGLVATLALLGWAGLYLILTTAVAGKTVGKALVGLKVVRRDGGPLHSGQAVVRVLMLPISTSFFGAGLVLIVLRRDHRALHDLVARTAVVYDWGDRPAELPAPLSAYLSARAGTPERE